MTPVPPPASPCVRVRLEYTSVNGTLAGSRFYLSYAGASPTAGNCTTLAEDIAAAWGTHLAPVVGNGYALTEVDVLDITTDLGLSGVWTGSTSGSEGATTVPDSAAMNVEYNISRRYRGGKPRMFLPPPSRDQMDGNNVWLSDFLGTVNTALGAFMTEIEALTIGAMGALAHVNLSYYKGFTNVTNSSGRERAVPTYRDTALLDIVQGYAAKATIGSQRRRLRSTSY